MSTLTPEDIERASGGRYKVQSVIGQGGMGTVYLAQNRELGSRVAIKVLTTDVIFNEGRMARFRREAALSAQLSHPNIVPVFELQALDDAAFLVMPFIDGVSLERHIKDSGPLPRADVESMLQQIGGALAYAHGKHVIHRDVKPANILLERDSGRWLLTDFGVAHVAVDGITQLTNTDATIGTLSYMAPEQLGSAREVDERADLYSLALVACEALLGKHPEREGPHETAKLLHEHVQGLNTDWARTLAWPLASARDERPPNIPIWLDRLKRNRFGRKRRRTTIAVGAVAIVSAIVWGFQQRGVVDANQPDIVAVLPVQITGTDPTLPDVGSVLALALTRQIQQLPGFQTLNEEAVRSRLNERYGGRVVGHDTLLTVARELTATEAVIGQATVEAGSLTVRVEVYDPVSGTLIDNVDVAKQPLDSLYPVVSEIVIRAFADRLAESFSGIATPSLPAGLPAISAFFWGDLALRQGLLENAVDYFDRVIEADPSFAPAYLKRALALTYRARPTEAGVAIRPAVDQANQNREGLDNVSQRLLDAVTTIIYDGDLTSADAQLRNIIGDNPNAVDVRFLLGALQARFPALINADYIIARRTLNEVLLRDPSYRLAYAVLIQIGVLLEDESGTRAAIRGYITTDSVSPRAEMARLADTLVFRPSEAARVRRSFPSRPPLVLENIAQAAGVLDPPGGTRAFAIGAIQTLLDIAITESEKAVAGRMRLGAFFGSGEFEAAARFVTQEANPRGIPAAEIDRWIVLNTVMGLPALADEARVRSAMTNLKRVMDDPVTSRWLVARWTRMFDPDSTPAADRALRIAKTAAAPDTIDAWAFELDLAAHDIVESDPARALALWRDAASRYSLSQVAFGLVSSRWTIQLDRIRTLASTGNFAEVKLLVDHFDKQTGFMDQMAWYPAFLTFADLATTRADSTIARGAIDKVLRNFSGLSRLRDSLRTAWDLQR